MNRITLSNLNAVSTLSNSEMSQTVGGKALVCKATIKHVTIRGPLGFMIRVPRPSVSCKVV